MPLFRRSDGDLLRNVGPLRRMMPKLMRGRNESIIFHTAQWDIAAARAWLREFNRSRRGTGDPATLFHMLVFACANMLHARPGLNRFVSGGRLYQRKGVWLSFALKKRMAEEEPLLTVKLEFPAGEHFDQCVERIAAATKDSRYGGERHIDSEVRLLTNLPGPLLTAILAGGRLLDRINLLPSFFIDPDPLYTSMFLANLGSIHIDSVHHHLYEYGTCSLFGVMGTVKKVMAVDRRGRPEVREVLQVNWSLDERVNDGFYCVESLAMLQRQMEDPATYFSRALGNTAAPVQTAGLSYAGGS
jgi:hypothetical protein